MSRYISDQDFIKSLETLDLSEWNFDIVNNTGDVLSQFVTDFSLLQQYGSPDIFNDCVVQIMTPDGQQVYYEPRGGKQGLGMLSISKTLSNSPDTRFKMVYDSRFGGYYLYPSAGDTSKAIYLDTDNNTFPIANSDQVPGDLSGRIFQLQNLSVNNGQISTKFVVKAGGQNRFVTIDSNNYPPLVSTPTSQPTTFTLKFSILGVNAWKILIQYNEGVGAKCCFNSSTMTKYDNFDTACKESGHIQGSDSCNASVGTACSQLIALGFEDPDCKSWCIKNPKDCYTHINTWCSNAKNENKDVCACFNQSKFEAYRDKVMKQCGQNCKISQFTAGCYYPPCLQSNMSSVYNQGVNCPANTTIYQKCINNLITSSGGSVSADQIVQKCQLNAEGADVENPIVGNDKTTTTSGKSTKPSTTTTTTTTNGKSTNTITTTPFIEKGKIIDIWQQYKWYIIGLIVAIIIAIIFYIVKKNKSTTYAGYTAI